MSALWWDLSKPVVIQGPNGETHTLDVTSPPQDTGRDAGRTNPQTWQQGDPIAGRRLLQDQWLNFVRDNYSTNKDPVSYGSSQGGFYSGGGNYGAGSKLGGLQTVVDAWNKSRGNTNAKVVPSTYGDLLDFGDGGGTADVIRATGEWQFMPGGDNAGWKGEPNSGASSRPYVSQQPQTPGTPEERQALLDQMGGRFKTLDTVEY